MQESQKLQIYRLIPNTLTLANGCFGLMAIYFLGLGWFRWGMVAISCSIVCDSLDGWTARKLGVVSKFGMQLDITADVVSFGVAPALLVLLYSSSMFSTLVALLYLCCAMWRLASFAEMAGLDYFIGLPSPVAASLVCLIALLFPKVLLVTCGLSAIAMVSSGLIIEKL